MNAFRIERRSRWILPCFESALRWTIAKLASSVPQLVLASAEIRADRRSRGAYDSLVREERTLIAREVCCLVLPSLVQHECSRRTVLTNQSEVSNASQISYSIQLFIFTSFRSRQGSPHLPSHSQGSIHLPRLAQLLVSVTNAILQQPFPYRHRRASLTGIAKVRVLMIRKIKERSLLLSHRPL
jgi:hypothetical protein